MFNYQLFLKRLQNRKIYKESFIKNEIAKRLLKRLDFIILEPNDILLDGYSDSDYMSILQSRFPNAKIHYPHKTNQESFDLIISNSIIHLTDNLADSLDDYYELLNDDGVLLFSTFGDKSFDTFKKTLAQISDRKHTNDMIDLLTWGDTLQSSRYKTPAIESDLINFTYEKLETVFADIRALNEPLADSSSHTALTGKNFWRKFSESFKQKLQLEIEALYGYAERKAQNNSIKSANPNRISLDELKKQIADFKKKF